MKKIEKLTPEQEAQLPVWRDKWIDIGLKTGETDWETFGAYMPVCYQKAGLKYPKKVIQVSSPVVGALASSIANKILKKKRSFAVGNAVGNAVSSAVGNAVSSAVGNAVDGAVRNAVSSAVSSAVGSAVGNAVRSAVDGAVSSAVSSAVDGAVSNAVRNEVRNAVGNAVRNAVSNAVSNEVGNAVDGAKLHWHYWLGGQFWVGGWWGTPSYVSFFTDVCGLKLSKDIQERSTAYRKICESVNYIWANSEFVMVCARPKKIERNSQGRLHSVNSKAIEYPDGWGLCFLNGVRFDEKLFKEVTSGKMPFEKILAIPDVDQRTQAMRFGDVEQFIKFTKGKLLDTYKKHTLDGVEINYSLYEIPKGDIFTQNVFYCIYDCPSTGKKYMQGVAPSKTVAEAMSWKISDELNVVTPEEWKTSIPLVHES